MADCSQFVWGSRQRQICDGESDLPIRRVNAFRAMYGVDPLPEFAKVATEMVVSGQVVSRIVPKFRPTKSAGGCCGGGKEKPIVTKRMKDGTGVGGRLISMFKAAGFVACPDCYKLAHKMNEWGAQGCRDKIDEIVADILPRALAWEEDQLGWFAKLIPGKVTALGIRELVVTAIETATPLEFEDTPPPVVSVATLPKPSPKKEKYWRGQRPPAQTTPSRIRQTNNPSSYLSRAAQYAAAMAKNIADDGAASSPEALAYREACCQFCPHNVANTCSLCSCHLVKNALNDGKLSWRSETCPAGKWFRQTDQQQSFVEPIRNLVFHIFPREGCEWNWHAHVQKIRENEAIWTGKRVISIGTGVGLASPETVQKQFDGIRVDHWVVMPNTPTVGETEPFIPALRLVESLDPNAMTMLAHCKGITHPQGSREGLWADMMWEVCLDLPSVDDALASHACAGPFKRHMRLLKSQWHYSGHFCWINNARVFSRPEWPNIVQQRAGMEAWLGAFIANKDAACLFHDDPPIGFLDENYWKNEVIPEFGRWKEARGMQ